MSDLYNEGVFITETNVETHSLTGLEQEDVISTGGSPTISFSSKEAARQIKAAIDPLTKQSELLCNSMKELRQACLKRSEETNGLSLSRAPNHRSDK